MTNRQYLTDTTPSRALADAKSEALAGVLTYVRTALADAQSVLDSVDDKEHPIAYGGRARVRALRDVEGTVAAQLAALGAPTTVDDGTRDGYDESDSDHEHCPLHGCVEYVCCVPTNL